MSERAERVPSAWAYQTPSGVDTTGQYDNWQWRISIKAMTDAPVGTIRNLTPLFDPVIVPPPAGDGMQPVAVSVSPGENDAVLHLGAVIASGGKYVLTEHDATLVLHLIARYERAASRLNVKENKNDLRSMVETDGHQGVGGTDTSAWLIERNDLAAFPVWYWEDPYKPGWHDWTKTAIDAKRFATKAEAEAFPDYKLIASDDRIKITEHVFLASPIVPSPSEGVTVKPLEWERIDHPHRPFEANYEVKKLRKRIAKFGPEVVVEILTTWGLMQPRQGSYAGALWAIAEWAQTILPRLEPSPSNSRASSDRLGRWLSAALDDPGVCVEMKADINAWFEAGQPPPLDDVRGSGFDAVAARAWDFVRPKLDALNKEKGPAGVWSNGFRFGWTTNTSNSRAKAMEEAVAVVRQYADEGADVVLDGIVNDLRARSLTSETET